MRVYIPSQLSFLMSGDLYKVATALFGYQKDGEVSYSNRNALYLHLDPAVAEQCVQTLIDYKIIIPTGMDGGVWRFRINVPVIEAAKSQPLTEIPSKPLLKLSTDITFKQLATVKERTSDEILAEIEALKRELMSKVQVQHHDGSSELPW